MDRIWKQIIITPGCWLWTGHLDDGYARTTVKGISRKKVLIHRVVYEHYNGTIPEGMVCDHLCRVRHCVNPEHIEIVHKKENTMRGFGQGALNSMKTHCPKGHEYSGFNLYIDKLGKRYCRTCQASRKRATK